ncbi:MAG: glutathione S-transferase family protein [Betaproteobacteria bacterium]|nr:glutathione S-transferase family protein [Betaproteobacteria bacterium]
MGQLLDGAWIADDEALRIAGGRFVRSQSSFRNWITTDGNPGPAGNGGFAAERGRYHLYISHACPWAHRTAIFRVLKRLEDAIGLSVTHWRSGEHGWTFEPGPGVVADSVNGAEYLYQIYLKADPRHSGRVSVPVLWDKKLGTIVNNESSEIIRMLNSAFDAFGAAAGDYYPANLRDAIDAINDRVYATLNNGVYRAGFARTQAAYEEAVVPLFETLDWLKARLARNRYLAASARRTRAAETARPQLRTTAAAPCRSARGSPHPQANRTASAGR